jgi:hypothetical protein
VRSRDGDESDLMYVDGRSGNTHQASQRREREDSRSSGSVAPSVASDMEAIFARGSRTGPRASPGLPNGAIQVRSAAEPLREPGRGAGVRLSRTGVIAGLGAALLGAVLGLGLSSRFEDPPAPTPRRATSTPFLAGDFEEFPPAPAPQLRPDAPSPSPAVSPVAARTPDPIEQVEASPPVVEQARARNKAPADDPKPRATERKTVRSEAVARSERVVAREACDDLPLGERAWCLRPAILAADDRLRDAYASATRAGVDGDTLARYNERWSRLRGRTRRDPEDVLFGYNDLADDLSRLTRRHREREARR